jgi:uncharacterized zinc-type alcohol dehydrogenase-like protein
LPVHLSGLIDEQKEFCRLKISVALPKRRRCWIFCAKHNLVADIELIRYDQVNEAYDRLQKGDVRYRFVIDMASLKN